MPRKSSKNLFKKQPIAIRAAIIGALLTFLGALLLMAFDRLLPNNTTVIYIMPTQENFVAITPLSPPSTQTIQLENPRIQSISTLNRAVRLQIPKSILTLPLCLVMKLNN
jgi:hypothetical protein